MAAAIVIAGAGGGLVSGLGGHGDHLGAIRRALRPHSTSPAAIVAPATLKRALAPISSTVPSTRSGSGAAGSRKSGGSAQAPPKATRTGTGTAGAPGSERAGRQRGGWHERGGERAATAAGRRCFNGEQCHWSDQQPRLVRQQSRRRRDRVEHHADTAGREGAAAAAEPPAAAASRTPCRRCHSLSYPRFRRRRRLRFRHPRFPASPSPTPRAWCRRSVRRAAEHRPLRATPTPLRCGLLGPFGAWRSLVARAVRVGEVPGSNPGAPTQKTPQMRGFLLGGGALKLGSGWAAAAHSIRLWPLGALRRCL